MRPVRTRAKPRRFKHRMLGRFGYDGRRAVARSELVCYLCGRRAGTRTQVVDEARYRNIRSALEVIRVSYRTKEGDIIYALCEECLTLLMTVPKTTHVERRKDPLSAGPGSVLKLMARGGR